MDTRKFSYNISDTNNISNLGDALASKYRIKILKLLTTKSYSVQELLKILEISPSTLSFHLKILKEANLIKYVKNPSKRGNEKNVSINVENINIGFAPSAETKVITVIKDIPLGSFANFDVKPPCLIANQHKIIDPVDNVSVFSSFERVEAELISFTTGFLEYNILFEERKNSKILELNFSQEISSECPNFNNTWKSNITFWINGVELGSYLSLGDYGGRKGKYSPSWWSIGSSNYGVLVALTVNDEGTFINGKKISDITLNKLNLKNNSVIKYRIGVKPDSKYAGGINIFGKHFGDYSQNISFSAAIKE